jgi:hypothetical protein
MYVVPQRLHERLIGATPAHLYGRGDECPAGPRRIQVQASLFDVLKDFERQWVGVEGQPAPYDASG